MFELKRPCKTCPFRKGQGSLFMLQRERLEGIVEAVAFQCHSTVDYSVEYEEDEEGNEILADRSGDHPMQCAGLMTVLHRENKPNQIMQVASRLGALDLDELDPKNQAYASLADVYAAHEGKEPK